MLFLQIDPDQEEGNGVLICLLRIFAFFINRQYRQVQIKTILIEMQIFEMSKDCQPRYDIGILKDMLLEEPERAHKRCPYRHNYPQRRQRDQ